MTQQKSQVVYKVPYADTDQMGVVYYANYLVYFERSRNQLLDDIELPYVKLEAEGLALPVVTAHVDYKKPAHFADTLVIHAWLAWAKGVRVQVNCEIYRGEELLTTGHTIHACLDIEKRRPTRVPARFYSVLAE